MALRLRIVSDHRHAMGARSSVVFGVAGGTLGRSVENDWVLQDNSRFVSSRHARILFRDHCWYLEDVSTNGTFLNDDTAALPKRTPCELHNGDLLRIGDYVVSVAIDVAGQSATARERTVGATTELTLLEGTGSPREGSLAPQVVGHLGEAFDSRALFTVQGDAAAGQAGALRGAIGGNALDQSGGLAVNSAFGQAVVVPFLNRSAAEAEPVADDSSDEVAGRRMDRLQRIVAEREAARQPPQGFPTGSTDPRPGLEALCRGAGLDPTLLGTDAAAAMLQLAGQLLRELVVGLRELELEKRSMLHRLGVETVETEAAAGFDLATAADELLLELLASHDSRRRDAAQWLRQALQGIRQHEEQLTNAHREAVSLLLTQLDPKDLEERFERSGNRNLMGVRPSNWELYREFFRSLRDSTTEPQGLPHVFVESFANAYCKKPT